MQSISMKLILFFQNQVSYSQLTHRVKIGSTLFTLRKHSYKLCCIVKSRSIESGRKRSN